MPLARYCLPLLFAAAAAPAWAQDATTTSVAATPSIVAQGQNVALTASVRRAAATGTPTGSVTFLYGSQMIGAAALNNGVATLYASSATVPDGTYSVVASYGGDADDSGSKSAAVQVQVKESATVTFTSTPYTVAAGSSVTLTAKVAGAGAAPGGTVSFLYSKMTLATVSVSNGTATFSESSAGVAGGLYLLTADYSGDANYAPASASLTDTVEAAKDCGTTTCATLIIPNDPPQVSPSEFHGYADPSMRKDPNSPLLYLGYSWPHHNVTVNTNAVDIHLAHSADGGSTWTEDGALFTSSTVTNTTSSAYAENNLSSFEVVDLLPVGIGSSTYWVQAHRQYYVADGTTGSLYGQAPVTSVIALSLLEVSDPGVNTAELLGLATAPETILGSSTTDATIPINGNLAALNSDVADCTNFDQPALAYQNGTLYLALECEDTKLSQPNDLAFPMFSTVPNSTDPRQWTWKYVGTIATLANAEAFGTEEGTPYQFLTELEFVHSANGEMLALFSPSVLDPTGEQPVIQYGCRFAPMLSFDPPVMQVDPNGAPLSVASVTDSSLYAKPNEGPGACTYDPASSTGVVLVHKLEDDSTEGFYVTLENSGIHP